MLKIPTTLIKAIAIAMGTTLASLYSLPLNAQSDRLGNNISQESITPNRNFNWNFSSENESISLQDNLQELREYSVSESDVEAENLKLTENTQKWGNRGDVEDRSFKVEVYDY
jgi:hypothetical protein